MKLDIADYASNPHRVRWIMAEKGITDLDAQLEGQAFIVADHLTIADIVAFCGLDFARIIRHRPDRQFANLGRWAKMMRERSAADEVPAR